MTSEEKSKALILEIEKNAQLQRMIESLQKQVASLQSEIVEMLRKMSDSVSQSDEKLAELLKLLKERDAKIEELQKLLAEVHELIKAKDEQLKLGRKNQFGSKSLKGSAAKEQQAMSHQEEKDDFDGTKSPASASNDARAVDAPQEEKGRTNRQKMG